MLDVVFILLIFFLVTASFVRESVVEINRPDSTTPSPLDRNETILVKINASDQIWIEDLATDPRALAAHFARFLAERPDATVAIHASHESSNGTLVSVIDQARLAGASKVSLAQ